MTAASPEALRCLVVANPASGGASGGLTRAVLERCRRTAVDVRLARTRGGGVDAGRVAAEVGGLIGGDRSLAVAVGGDGTVREVAEGLMRGLRRWPPDPGAPAPAVRGPADRGACWALVVVPAGTGNSVYRALWEDRPWQEVLDGALAGGARARGIDVGRIAATGEAVVLGASAGLLAEVAARARSLHTVAGRERYAAAAAAALGAHAPFPGRVEVDCEVCAEGLLSLVAVGGGRYRGGTFDLLPRSVLDDGLLDVCAVAATGRERLGELALLAAEGRHVAEPEVSYRQGRSVAVRRTDGQDLVFEHDGDPCAVGAEVTLEVRAKALPVAQGSRRSPL